METKTIIETIGSIEKKETLVGIGYDDMALESLYPFPGYHGETVPDTTNPKSAFLITKTNYPEEKIIRATLKAKNLFPHPFDGSPGTVTLFNESKQCIRIKDLKNYNHIPELVEAFKKNGIEFMKGKKVDPYEGLIKITKYFLLDELDQGVYMDKETPEMAYFEVDTELPFDDFEQITLNIKRNIREDKWDAAQGIFYRKKGIVDVIRIYDLNVCLGQCLYLREKYENEIKRYLGAKKL